MVTSSTGIAKLSADLLSTSGIIDIVDPSTATESLFTRWYDVVRKKLLRSHPWNFASKRTTLAASSTTPDYGYESSFTLPADFIRLLSLQDSEGNDIDPRSYQLENGAILYTGDIVYLRYISDVTNVALFDSLFIDLFAIDLALAVAMKVTGQVSDVQRLNELRKIKMSEAKSIDGQERPPTVRIKSRALSARRALTTNGYAHRIVFD